MHVTEKHKDCEHKIISAQRYRPCPWPEHKLAAAFFIGGEEGVHVCQPQKFPGEDGDYYGWVARFENDYE